MVILRCLLVLVLAAAMCGCGVLNGLVQLSEFTEPQTLLLLDGREERHHKVLPPETQKAFLQLMISHHQMAIDMANMALERAELAEIKVMAQGVIAAQSAEVTEMESIQQRLLGASPTPDGDAAGTLGLTDEQTGMDMDMAELMDAGPFDQTFIDMMIMHHQGAINMARALLYNNTDTELGGLANSIITAQSAEIEEMNAIRTEAYGSPSPSGGIPALIPDTVRH